jgi:hypothetical protein
MQCFTETMSASQLELHCMWSGELVRAHAQGRASTSQQSMPRQPGACSMHARTARMHPSTRKLSLPEHELKLLLAHLGTPLEDKCRPQVGCCISAGAYAREPKGTDDYQFACIVRMQFFELGRATPLSLGRVALLTGFRIGRFCGTRSTGLARSHRARAWLPAFPLLAGFRRTRPLES